MSKKANRTRNVETLAWITDDEAEFWTVKIELKIDEKKEKIHLEFNSNNKRRKSRK